MPEVAAAVGSWSDRAVAPTDAGAFQSLVDLAISEREASSPVREGLLDAWRALGSGDPWSDARVEALEKDARQQGQAELVIEAAALRAMAAAELGALDHALACARRASRMGRTEKLPHAEYLAGLVLARMRRLTGQPHLATRIAIALRSIAPSGWHRWIDWELALATGSPPPDADGAAGSMRTILTRAGEGDRAGFAAAVNDLRARLDALAPLRRDLERAVAVLDPDSETDDEPALDAWIRGDDAFAPAPWGLAGLGGPGDDDASATTGVALVIARPGRRGRRVLRASGGLARACGDATWLESGTVGRVEGLVSALALLGPEGAEDEALFRSVYGFAYVPTLHRGTFDVALHRARARVEALGQIVREDGLVRLEITEPFVVPDPRSTPGTDNRVLGRLARTRELSARELAQTLGMPLRTVQDALRGLVEGGACRQQRDGRRVLYAIEDTTFQEPTEARLASKPER